MCTVVIWCLLKCETLHSESESMGCDMATESSVLALWKDRRGIKNNDGLGTS